jgi:hypothetical protein
MRENKVKTVVDPEGSCRCPADGAALWAEMLDGSMHFDSSMVREAFYGAVEREQLVEASMRRPGRVASGCAVGRVHLFLDAHELHRSDVPTMAF